MIKTLPQTLLLSLAFATGSAHASLINIDFQGVQDGLGTPSAGIGTVFAGAGVLGPAGPSTWNAVGVTDFTNLFDANGSATNVDVTTNHTGSYQNGGANEMLRDRIIWGPDRNGPASILLSDLMAGAVYNVVAYNGCYGQNYSVTTGGGAAQSTTATLCDGVGAYSDGLNYVRWDGLQADANGRIELASVATDTSIAGLQIEKVPEPGVLALMAVGLLGLSASKRRARA